MNKKIMVFKVLGLVVTTAYYAATLVIESKKKTKLTDEDKDDIAERVAVKVKKQNKKLLNGLYGKEELVIETN